MLTEDRMLAALYITVFLLFNSGTGHRCWYWLKIECWQHDILQCFWCLTVELGTVVDIDWRYNVTTTIYHSVYVV